MATAAATESTSPAKGKSKLLIIIVAVAVLLLGGGGAAMFLLKKKADAEAEAADGEEVVKPKKEDKKKKEAHGGAPIFAPLDPFTVNLADRDTERYAQVGITLELDDPKMQEEIKSFMPAIRNVILMAIADRTAAELQSREGKGKLAERVRREASRVLGAEVDDDEEDADVKPEARTEGKPPKKKKKKREPELPIKAVHFSNFILQ